jgi:hypothetical protein
MNLQRFISSKLFALLFLFTPLQGKLFSFFLSKNKICRGSKGINAIHFGLKIYVKAAAGL